MTNQQYLDTLKTFLDTSVDELEADLPKTVAASERRDRVFLTSGAVLGACNMTVLNARKENGRGAIELEGKVREMFLAYTRKCGAHQEDMPHIDDDARATMSNEQMPPESSVADEPVIVVLDPALDSSQRASVIAAFHHIKGVNHAYGFTREIPNKDATNDEVCAHLVERSAKRALVLTGRLLGFQARCAKIVPGGMSTLNDDSIIEWVAQGASFLAVGRHVVDKMLPEISPDVYAASLVLAWRIAMRLRESLEDFVEQHGKNYIKSGTTTP